MNLNPAISNEKLAVAATRPGDVADTASPDLTFHKGARPNVTVPEGTQAKVKTEDLRVYFGKTRVLHGITMAIIHGAVTAIIGPSGCGKSTYLRCMNRMHEVTPGARVEGRILLDEEDIHQASMDPVLVRSTHWHGVSEAQSISDHEHSGQRPGGSPAQWATQG